LAADYWEPELCQFRQLLASGSILDAGCGNGRDYDFFRRVGYSYTGIDVSSQMLAIARDNHPDGAFASMDVCDLAFDSLAFDGIWCVAVLLHFPKAVVDRPLQELCRVLRKGGVVFFAVRDGSREYMSEEQEGTQRFFAEYSVDELSDRLSQSGLTPIHVCTRDAPGEDQARWTTAFAVKGEVEGSHQEVMGGHKSSHRHDSIIQQVSF
jgi:SAM-dependent methyltransferase